ncbi:thioredoxin family protein [Paenibacillus sp. PK4536]|uniref:thioredoxin family protein n=1 Tax=Paenibacillus sp. PK4536 TaxID=3024576 RepID=UPI0023594342|nr:thioredoxin family protein [Paenibacillus sp. PK4536]WIM40021.1 thioredoxin family protein [Paenibacillus sp. PK4536]
MKNSLLIFLGIILIISLFFSVYFYNENIKLKKNMIDLKESISNTYNYLDSITVTNFEKKVVNKEKFIVYIGRPDCNDCLFFEPMFEKFVYANDLNNKIVYLNIRDYRAENEKRWNEFKRKYGFQQTPAIIYFEDGKNKNVIEWSNEKGLPIDDLKKWLKNNKLIK